MGKSKHPLRRILDKDWKRVRWVLLTMALSLAAMMRFLGTQSAMPAMHKEPVRYIALWAVVIVAGVIWAGGGYLCLARIWTVEVSETTLPYLRTLPISRRRLWWLKAVSSGVVYAVVVGGFWLYGLFAFSAMLLNGEVYRPPGSDARMVSTQPFYLIDSMDDPYDSYTYERQGALSPPAPTNQGPDWISEFVKWLLIWAPFGLVLWGWDRLLGRSPNSASRGANPIYFLAAVCLALLLFLTSEVFEFPFILLICQIVCFALWGVLLGRHRLITTESRLPSFRMIGVMFLLGVAACLLILGTAWLALASPRPSVKWSARNLMNPWGSDRYVEYLPNLFDNGRDSSDSISYAFSWYFEDLQDADWVRLRPRIEPLIEDGNCTRLFFLWNLAPRFEADDSLVSHLVDADGHVRWTLDPQVSWCRLDIPVVADILLRVARMDTLKRLARAWMTSSDWRERLLALRLYRFRPELAEPILPTMEAILASARLACDTLTWSPNCYCRQGAQGQIDYLFAHQQAIQRLLLVPIVLEREARRHLSDNPLVCEEYRDQLLEDEPKLMASFQSLGASRTARFNLDFQRKTGLDWSVADADRIQNEDLRQLRNRMKCGKVAIPVSETTCHLQQQLIWKQERYQREHPDQPDNELFRLPIQCGAELVSDWEPRSLPFR